MYLRSIRVASGQKCCGKCCGLVGVVAQLVVWIAYGVSIGSGIPEQLLELIDDEDKLGALSKPEFAHNAL